MLAAYTRFSNIITDATSEDVVQEKEVFAFKELVILAAILVVFVFIFAFVTAIMEAYVLSNDLDADLVHYDFWGCRGANMRKPVSKGDANQLREIMQTAEEREEIKAQEITMNP